MHFCTVCQNMYYIRIDSENPNKLIHYCRNCGNEEELTGSSNIYISKTQVKKSKQNFNHIVNKYTKLDPTLPRINTVLCPNVECVTNKDGKPREIIYIRYDNSKMKYIYLCSDCETVWQTNEPA